MMKHGQKVLVIWPHCIQILTLHMAIWYIAHCSSAPLPREVRVMNTRLLRALDSNKDEILAGIREAEGELEKCLRRCEELRVLIARGKAALGHIATSPSAESKTEAHGDRPTLHDEMVVVLRTTGNQGMTAKQLADA